MKDTREQPVQVIIKRKGHGGGHHGGAWKVAFADFMTSMMALFLVLWLVTQSSDIKAAIAGYFQDPLGHANEFGSSMMPGEGAQTQAVRPLSRKQIMELRMDRLRMLGQKIRDKLANTPELGELASHIEIQMVDEGLRIQLLEDSAGVFFATGSASPFPPARRLLRLLGHELSGASNDVVIEGHTDARRYALRDRYSNWELSTDRANAARRILLDGGLNEKQVVQVRGYADRRLRTPSEPYDPSNRRVTIVMLVDSEDTPGIDLSEKLPKTEANDDHSG